MENFRVLATISWLLFLYITNVQINVVSSLSCSCNKDACSDETGSFLEPICCFSGKTSKDACACCNQCTKMKAETCGGPWMIDGKCGPDDVCVLFNKRDEKKTLDSQKLFMQNNDGNGTCYTKSDYEGLADKFKDEFVILEKPGGSESQESAGTIKNCDDVLRAVKSNLPEKNDIPEGYKALRVNLKENWQNEGGLAKCKVDESCPKAEYEITDQIKELRGITALPVVQNENGVVHLVGHFYVISFCLAFSFLKYLN